MCDQAVVLESGACHFPITMATPGMSFPHHNGHSRYGLLRSGSIVFHNKVLCRGNTAACMLRLQACHLHVSRLHLTCTLCCSEAKLQVTARLKKLLKRLRTANVITAGLVIGRARIPIIKASTKQGNYSLDISMGTTNGAAAVCLLRHQVQAVPPLRPLALVIRALLKVSCNEGHLNVAHQHVCMLEHGF